MDNLKLFESKQVRTEWNPKEQKCYFAIVDVIAILAEIADPGAYRRKLKERLKIDCLLDRSPSLTCWNSG